MNNSKSWAGRYVLLAGAVVAGVACTPMQVPAQQPVVTANVLATPLSVEATQVPAPVVEATPSPDGDLPAWWTDTAYATLSGFFEQVQNPWAASVRGWIYLKNEKYMNPAAVLRGTVPDLDPSEGPTVMTETWYYFDEQGNASQSMGRAYQAGKVLVDQTLCNLEFCSSTRRGDYPRPATDEVVLAGSVDGYLVDPEAPISEAVSALSVDQAGPIHSLRSEQTQAIGELNGNPVLIISSIDTHDPVAIFEELPEAIGNELILHFDLSSGDLVSSESYFRFVDGQRLLMYAGYQQVQSGVAPPSDLLEAFTAWEETK